MEDIYYYRTACTFSPVIMLEKSFGLADVTVFIKQRPNSQDIRHNEGVGILADELSNLLNDPQLEEILK